MKFYSFGPDGEKEIELENTFNIVFDVKTDQRVIDAVEFFKSNNISPIVTLENGELTLVYGYKDELEPNVKALAQSVNVERVDKTEPEKPTTKCRAPIGFRM